MYHTSFSLWYHKIPDQEVKLYKHSEGSSKHDIYVPGFLLSFLSHSAPPKTTLNILMMETEGKNIKKGK